MNNSATQPNLSDVMDSCLNLDNPKSFFLFAGAGSGKTRALVDAMKIFRQKYGQQFRQSGRKVAVITYTNAACDEIKHRIDYDSIFAVSTIHSFAWELIRTYSKDISEWLSHNLELEINDLQDKQQKGRAGSKAAFDRAVQIEQKHKRLERLDTIKYFTYNPNGENIGKNSLNHNEVIEILADFLANKSLMKRILIRKYPVLLIDESQDTQKDLVDAFFEVQSKHSGEFCLALFGDTMQRIYSHGKSGLAEAVPDEWEKPAIVINHRCPKRVVRLINKIRAAADDHEQEPRKDAREGFVRLFLVQDDDGINKNDVEDEISKRMIEITLDAKWSGDDQDIVILTLEHHMAARRGGFIGFFEPLYQIAKFKTGLIDGSLSGISLLSQQVLLLVKSLRDENEYAVAKIVKKYSPLMTTDALKTSESPLDEIRKSDAAVRTLFSLWDNDNDPSLIDCLKSVAASGLFAIPDIFALILSREGFIEDESKLGDSIETDDTDPGIDAWGKALSVPFSQLESYVQYISDESHFFTHQGIKGLQFPRVMVILDDNEARGFMFSYGKLIGDKAPTSTDLQNVQEGKETSIDRTRRLFYVTSSRAQKSLVIVVYTKEKNKIKSHLQELAWFVENEIIDFEI